MSDAVDLQEGRTDHTHDFQDPRFRGSWSGYERDCLFFNARGPKFFDAGHAFAIDFDDDGRAVAPVDVDGDGDLDLALLSLQGLRLLENRSTSRPFARVKLEAAKGDPQAIGATVTVKAGGVTQRDFVKSSTGFATQVPLDLHFGLGAAEKIDEIEIRWRDGAVETHRDLAAGGRIVIKQGEAPRIEPIPRWSAPPRVAGRIKAPAGASGVYRVKDAKEPAAVALKADEGSTFVFDPEGRLRRAFYRPADDDEVAKSVKHLGQGLFHADFTAVATYHLSREEFDLAERALKSAIDIHPRFATAHYYLGRLRSFQGRHAEAAESFQRAVLLDSTYRIAAHNLGVALYKARRLPEAAEALKRTLAIGDGAETRHVLGQVLAESGKLDDAAEEMRKAVELDPRNANAHGDLGKVLMAQGKLAEAEQSLLKAIELDPKLEEAKENLRKVKQTPK